MILTIEQGPNAGQRWTINGPDATIGRDDNCDVPLQDERASGRHARVWLDGGAWWVQDLNSTNGTWVNAKRLQGPSRLQTGDQLRLGLTTLSLVLESLPTSPRTGQGAQAPEIKVTQPPASAALGRSKPAQPEIKQYRGDVAAGLVDGLVGLAGLMLLLGALLPWIRISVDVPFAGEITATPAGTQGMGTYTMIAGVLSLVLAIVALAVRAVTVTHVGNTATERARAILRWSGLPYTLIAMVLLVFSLLSLMRYYQSANRDVFLGIRLIDLFGFAVDWLDLKLIPQIGLILTGLGMILLLLGALARLVVGALMEKPIMVIERKRELLKLVLLQDAQPNLEFAVADGITFGRGEDNHIVIQDDLASRHHAEILWRDGGYAVNDRGSTNGVLVNGQRIAGPQRVSPGDRIQIGRAEFEVYGETGADSGVPLSANGYGLGKHRTGPSQSPDQPLLWALAAVGGLLFLAVIGGAILLLSRDREQGVAVEPNLFQEMATAIPADLLKGDESIISPLAIPTISFPVLQPTAEPEAKAPQSTVPGAASPHALASLSMELPIGLPNFAIVTVKVVSRFA